MHKLHETPSFRDNTLDVSFHSMLLCLEKYLFLHSFGHLTKNKSAEEYQNRNEGKNAFLG